MYNDLFDSIGYLQNTDPELGDAMALELTSEPPGDSRPP